MRDSQPKTIFLKDYVVPDYLIDSTELEFELFEDKTTVSSKLAIRRNPQSKNSSSAPLILDGQELKLKSLQIDGSELSSDQFSLTENALVIDSVPEQFLLHCVTEIKPQENTSLEGLYKSHTMFCTQCEAEGFRKITYYLDRPDVMSIFTVKIIAEKNRYLVLLSNGNNTEQGENPDGSHWSVWHDPHKKPAYLFALVAGDLASVEDEFTTASGCEVKLRIFVESKDVSKCDHAMASLKNSMKWDEEVYGREYDLDIFNIVAVDDFNMGAMENKSLNIFNTSCVLARPESTTDAGFQRVEAVVAHEYFHNWSGNRVTCRDWFQLSLKEGFTVFRDAEFSADMGSRTVKRVEDVALLRTVQFSEDAGPMAHPVRPDSYMEISNFYTVTIYEKGAEVVRMIHQLLGPEDFRKGSDLYFERHDGEAVTCEDFVLAMEEASSRDLQQFRRWYSQAGTPLLSISGHYDASQQSYRLSVSQSCAATPGQDEKAPFHIPLKMALLGKEGALPLSLAESSPSAVDAKEVVLDITDFEQEFIFENICENPVPSLLRGFSAPVKMIFEYSREQLSFIMNMDSDGFCRWDAGQQLGVLALQDMVAAHQSGQEMQMDVTLLAAFRSMVESPAQDKAMLALMLRLPSEAYMAEISSPVDVEAIHLARSLARLKIAEALEEGFWRLFQNNQDSDDYQASAEQIARRSLKNTALSYLMLLESERALSACVTQFQTAANMTDVMAAFTALLNSPFGEQKASALESFYQRWKDEALVVNQWFMAQACCLVPGTLEHVKGLMKHPAFDLKNPNKVRALIGAFCGQNAVNFHQTDGAGYVFLADQIISLNKLNPQIAARLLGPLTKWKKYTPTAQSMMRAQLERIMAEGDLSKDVFEVVSKSLKV